MSLLRWGLTGVYQLRNSCDELRWGEGLREHDTIWHAPRSPIGGAVAGYVDYWNICVDLASTTRDIPTIDLSAKIDVSDQSPIFGLIRVQQFNGIFAGRNNFYIVSAVFQGFFEQRLK